MTIAIKWDGIGPKKNCLLRIKTSDLDGSWVQEPVWVEAAWEVCEKAINKPVWYCLNLPTHNSNIYPATEGKPWTSEYDPQGILTDSDDGPIDSKICEITHWAELPTVDEG